VPGRTSTGPLLTMTAIAPVARPARRDQLTRRIRLLVAATMSYNIIEAVSPSPPARSPPPPR